MSRKRSSFTPEFKDELVKLYLDQRARKSLAEVARDNGVGAEHCPKDKGDLTGFGMVRRGRVPVR
jgi:transposase-like protein